MVLSAARIRAYGTRALQFASDNRPAGDGYAKTENPNFSVFYDAPTVIIISGRVDNRLALEECTRAGQILTISACARGLGTCWVGSPMLWLRDPDVCVELGIPTGLTPLYRVHAWLCRNDARASDDDQNEDKLAWRGRAIGVSRPKSGMAGLEHNLGIAAFTQAVRDDLWRFAPTDAISIRYQRTNATHCNSNITWMRYLHVAGTQR